jgi:hypothetical protein
MPRAGARGAHPICGRLDGSPDGGRKGPRRIRRAREGESVSATRGRRGGRRADREPLVSPGGGAAPRAHRRGDAQLGASRESPGWAGRRSVRTRLSSLGARAARSRDRVRRGLSRSRPVQLFRRLPVSGGQLDREAPPPPSALSRQRPRQGSALGALLHERPTRHPAGRQGAPEPSHRSERDIDVEDTADRPRSRGGTARACIWSRRLPGTTARGQLPGRPHPPTAHRRGAAARGLLGQAGDSRARGRARAGCHSGGG